MAGQPVAREMSPDGRWAYTLYGGGEETFIHALDTEGETAVCIDLEDIAPARHLPARPGGGPGDRRELDRARARRARWRTSTRRGFEVTERSSSEVVAAARRTTAAAPSAVAWAAIGAAALLLVGGAAALLCDVGRRRPDDVDEAALERLVPGRRRRSARREREREPEPVP